MLETVSVVLTTYNRGAAVARTLDAVLRQTRAPLEILVADDGSTDGTPDWIEARYGARVRVLRGRNGGVARARNRGWRAATGDWIAFLDHDDAWHPEKLERTLAAATPQSNVIVSRWREVAEPDAARPSRDCGRVSPPWKAAQLAPRAAFAWLLGWHNPLVSASAVMVRRKALERAGGFDARCVPADDWDLWLRLARFSEFVLCDEVALDYALHAGQQRRDTARMFRAVRRTLGRHPLALARRPLLLWWLLWSGAFAPSIAAYERARDGDAAAWRAAWRAHPLALLSPQWLALLARRALAR